MSDYYSILGVSKNASDTEIRRAYHDLAREYHPDKNTQDSTEIALKKFKEISKAYEVLSNAISRRDYDRELDEGEIDDQLAATGFSFRDPFELLKEYIGLNEEWIDSRQNFQFEFDETLDIRNRPDLSNSAIYQNVNVIRFEENGHSMEQRSCTGTNGMNVVEFFEDGELKARFVNGLQEHLTPSVSNTKSDE